VLCAPGLIPRAPTDAMQIASTPLPLVIVFAVIRATLNDPARARATALQAFRCT